MNQQSYEQRRKKRKQRKCNVDCWLEEFIDLFSIFEHLFQYFLGLSVAQNLTQQKEENLDA